MPCHLIFTTTQGKPRHKWLAQGKLVRSESGLKPQEFGAALQPASLAPASVLPGKWGQLSRPQNRSRR